MRRNAAETTVSSALSFHRMLSLSLAVTEGEGQASAHAVAEEDDDDSGSDEEHEIAYLRSLKQQNTK